MVTDPQGSVVGTVHNTDWASGVSRKRPDPFGGARSTTSVTSQGRGFLGAVHDSNALVLLGARYLDPATGGFISMDPLLDPLTPSHANSYAYANNNPVAMSDQSGLYPISWISDGGGGKRKGASSHDRRDSAGKSAKRPTAATGSGAQECGSDWSCEIAKNTKEYGSKRHCSGAGRFTQCGTKEYVRGGVDFSYTHSWRVASRGATTPEDAMAVFQASPDKVFPFKIDGCGQLVSGSRCVLHTDQPNLPGYLIVPFDSVGTVGVDTTSTSVKFTVLSLDYFDGPGSTIEFSTSLGEDGAVYLSQTANALGGRHWMALAASPPLWIPSPAEHAWGLQADALSGLLR